MSAGRAVLTPTSQCRPRPSFLVVRAQSWAGTGNDNPQPTSPISRQIRASPSADRAVSGGFQRSQVASANRPGTGGISLDSLWRAVSWSLVRRPEREGILSGMIGFLRRASAPELWGLQNADKY